MIYLLSDKNNALKILQFNTSQKKLAFYEIFVYRTLVGEMVWKLSILTLKLLNLLKSRLSFKERWKISRVKKPKAKKVCAEFSLKQQKKCLPFKTWILFRQATRQSSSCNFTKKWILHLSRAWFCPKIQNSYFPRNLFLEPRIIKCEQRVSDRKLCMLWIWSYPVSKKELFLKLAFPKKQAKSLKTIGEELRFYCIYRQFFHKYFPRVQ